MEYNQSDFGIEIKQKLDPMKMLLSTNYKPFSKIKSRKK
jgi:hypothetical protein